MPIENLEINGLTDEEVLLSRKKHGSNTLEFKKDRPFVDALISLFKEPMVIILLLASTIYFISGNIGDGLFLVAAIFIVGSISLYQDSRSRNALEKLKAYTQPDSKVIRNGRLQDIKSVALVVGDSLMIEEGNTIPADGKIIHSNDFSVDESILTGESLPVYKDIEHDDNSVYSGTIVGSGLAVVSVTHVGNDTKLGKIGKSLEQIGEEKTPVQIQIVNFVKQMVVAGIIVFMIVWLLNYLQTTDILQSLLLALTLAMSILPEEIPVAFTTFMAIGAWRLMNMGIIVKQMKTVETLGSATVICVDKTGTITQNKMKIARVFSTGNGKIVDPEQSLDDQEKELLTLAMWASEPIPFDPMEVELHKLYADFSSSDERPQFKMIHEYPLGGKPPMMTHIFEDSSGKRIISVKGAPEALFQNSDLAAAERERVEDVLTQLTSKGYRVLGVGEAHLEGNDFPSKQQDFNFQFKGLVAFYDPPKANIKAVFESFEKAGIKIKIITGDNAATTMSIANQIGFSENKKHLSGDDLMTISNDDFEKRVADTHIFTRMFPDAKLKVIQALKAQNEIVAMTGDGVNDGPALKSAHIGIAMGKKGTGMAKDAASIILVDDDLSRMVDAIAMGRKIYTNLKKAIQYIISIHIPIILTVFLPLALGWLYPNIFLPAHVILLELIMGPTCSIIYENEPMEPDTMVKPPRTSTDNLFNGRELLTSIIQGLVITAGTLAAYQIAVKSGWSEHAVRAMVFSTLIFANIFLTLVNRSFYYSIFTTIRYKNILVPIIIFITILILGALLYVGPLASFFRFDPLDLQQALICLGLGFGSVMWFEVYKWGKRLI